MKKQTAIGCYGHRPVADFVHAGETVLATIRELNPECVVSIIEEYQS